MRADGSANTLRASSKPKRCFLRFSSALLGSHSNSRLIGRLLLSNHLPCLRILPCFVGLAFLAHPRALRVRSRGRRVQRSVSLHPPLTACFPNGSPRSRGGAG